MKWVLRILAALFGLLLLAFFGLLIASHRPDANKLEGSVEIARPPAEVWPWIVEPEKQTQWVSWLVESKRLPDGPLQPGSRFRWVMVDPNRNSQRGSFDSEVVAVNAPGELDLKFSAKTFDGHAAYTLAALPNGGTRITNSGRYNYQSWFVRLMTPLIMPVASKKMNADMAQLKRLVEQIPKTQ